MQVFLPEPNFVKSISCLDKKRCWKQLIECDQILQILANLKNPLCVCGHKKSDHDTTDGGCFYDYNCDCKQFTAKAIAWANHPAVKQWIGHDSWLREYRNVCWQYCIDVWGIKTKKRYSESENFDDINDPKPWWLGIQKYHDSHKSKLLQKNPEWYGQFNWEVALDLPYWWPTNER